MKMVGVLCGADQETMKGDETNSSNAVNNMISEISAELQREKQRNSELIMKISLLESQLQHQVQRDDHHLTSSLLNEQGGSPNARGRRFKKFKKQRTEAAGTVKIEGINMNAHNLDLRSSLVNWVGPDDHHFPNLENSKHTDSLLEFEENSVDSDDGNDKDFNGNEIEQKDDNLEGEKQCTDSLCIGNSAVGHGDTIEKERINMKLSMQIKSQKMPFCPKEVTRILQSKELFLKNAQSHTVRKIIVFASLGIKHGCEDMYNLDFNHFKILQKGASYESPQNPGEHVVYENPGVRKKIFYPNRQNPTLCPIRILEEEKEMRPHDITCPSCLFLCIKYGGSTRNLPQQEYVRQQMGRNKLKSFGPIICRMAMLAHVRDGSFFFKALGITLLFIAGFSDDLVRLQTKYKNLDLLQKYYRTDEDTDGKELFLSYQSTWHNLGTPSSRRLTGKSKTSKKHILPNHTSNCTPSTSSTRTQFAFLDFNSSQTRAIQSMISQTPAGPSNFYYPNQSPYPIFPPHLANSFMPMMYWPPPNAFPPPFTCQSFSSTGNYISTHSQPLFTHVSSNTLEPNMVNYVVKNGPGLEKTDNDSSSSSSNTEPKET